MMWGQAACLASMLSPKCCPLQYNLHSHRDSPSNKIYRKYVADETSTFNSTVNDCLWSSTNIYKHWLLNIERTSEVILVILYLKPWGPWHSESSRLVYITLTETTLDFKPLTPSSWRFPRFFPPLFLIESPWDFVSRSLGYVYAIDNLAKTAVYLANTFSLQTHLY